MKDIGGTSFPTRTKNTKEIKKKKTRQILTYDITYM